MKDRFELWGSMRMAIRTGLSEGLQACIRCWSVPAAVRDSAVMIGSPKEGGCLAPDDSRRSRLVKKIMRKDAAKDKKIMKLYEENGVYNFYLKVGGKDGSLEYVPEEKPELKSLNLEEMSREELVKTLEEVRPSGFTRQPKA